MSKYLIVIIALTLFLSASVSGQNCVKFDGIGINTEYGNGINFPGDVIIVEDGIEVSVVDFFWDPTTTHFGNCKIVDPFPGFGDGPLMSVNNINLLFNFNPIAPSSLISLEFADFGGFENLEINGHQIFIDELSWNLPGNPAPDITLFYSTNLTTQGFLRTKLLIYGDVRTLLIGGQEFFIDNICSHGGGGGTIYKYCVDFESITMGKRFGNTVNMPGDHIFTENSNEVFVLDFFWNPTTPYFGNCEIMAATPDFGDGQVMGINNINLHFNFGSFGVVNRVMFDYADYGGFENTEINGHPIPLFIGEMEFVPGGVTPGLTWYISLIKTSFIKATVMIVGNVQDLIVGGQEFMLDNVCVYTPTSVHVEQDLTLLHNPGDFRLEQNFPNPFNPATEIRYSIGEKSHIALSVTNIQGKQICNIVNVTKPAGHYSVIWNGCDDMGNQVSSGVYLIVLKTPNCMQIKKALLIR